MPAGVLALTNDATATGGAEFAALAASARAHEGAGRIVESLRDHLAALVVARRDRSQAMEAQALCDLGRIHAALLNFDEAAELCARSFAVASEAGAGDIRAAAGAEWMLALDGLGRRREAHDLALQLLADRDRVVAAEHDAATTGFATMMPEAGDPRRAELAIAERIAVDGSTRPAVRLRALHAASAAYESRGDFGHALQLWKEAFALHQRLVETGARAKRVMLEAESEIERVQWQRDQALEHQRNAEVEQERLAGLYRALEQAGTARTRFLAAASHDLRQPVHAIGLFADALVERCAAGEERDIATRIRQAMDAMNTMLTELLDFSALEAGERRCQPIPLPIADLLSRIDAEFGPIARSRGLDLRLAGPDAWVRSDPALLARILQNLVANALAFTASGGVLVSARARGDAMLIEVWDTGIGIDAAHLPRIFDEFYQVPARRREPRQGMGLGLAIVRRLADLSGHPIEVRSRVGRGTRFRLTLPRAAPAEPPAPELFVAPIDLTGRVALIVDDDADVRDGVVAALTARGSAVIAAASPEEAIARLDASGLSPDFAVMDYRLETQTGLEALAAIRAHLRQELPALIVTGDALASSHADPGVGNVLWLVKPVSAAQLRQAVMLALAK